MVVVVVVVWVLVAPATCPELNRIGADSLFLRQTENELCASAD